MPHVRAAAQCGVSRGSVRHVALVAVLMFLFVPPRAHADLILVEFATSIPSLLGGSFAGAPFLGSFIYDDIGTGICLTCPTDRTTDALDVHLTLGNYHFDFSHIAPPPTVFLPLGSGFWGPLFHVRPQFLPPGLSELSLGPGAAVFPLVSFSNGDTYLTQCAAPGFTDCSLSITPLPPQSIPEPMSLLFAINAIVCVVIARRRFKNNYS